MRRLLGFLAVALLKILARLPLRLLLGIGAALLPFYIPFRRRTCARLRQLSRVGLRVQPYPYYCMRLRLALLSLKHLRALPDGCTIHVEGREHYEAALASGKPVVVLGWHQGPVELLHRVPQSDPDARGKPAFLLTAKAFAPALTSLMKQGRVGTHKEILHPGSMTGLKRWEKENGILAVMVDQVPGIPETWLSLFEDKVRIPYPGKLLEWITARDAEFLTVSVQWKKGNRIEFRYQRLEPEALKTGIEERLRTALTEASEQYNWSYPKVLIS